MKSTIQKEIDQIDKVKRDEIKARIKALGVTDNFIVMESQLTSLPNYLRGKNKKIKTGTMFILERTLSRLESENGTS